MEARDDSGYMALHHAAMDGYPDVVRALLEGGANVNAWKGQRDWAAIHAAAQQGHYDVVKLLIDRGADIDAECNTSGSPLDTAMQLGTEAHQRIAQLLAEKGAVSRSRIHTACYLGDVDSVKVLIKAGIDVNIRDSQGLTALALAKQENHTEVIELLRRQRAKE